MAENSDKGKKGKTAPKIKRSATSIDRSRLPAPPPPPPPGIPSDKSPAEDAEDISDSQNDVASSIKTTDLMHNSSHKSKNKSSRSGEIRKSKTKEQPSSTFYLNNSEECPTSKPPSFSNANSTFYVEDIAKKEEDPSIVADTSSQPLKEDATTGSQKSAPNDRHKVETVSKVSPSLPRKPVAARPAPPIPSKKPSIQPRKSVAQPRGIAKGVSGIGRVVPRPGAPPPLPNKPPVGAINKPDDTQERVEGPVAPLRRRKTQKETDKETGDSTDDTALEKPEESNDCSSSVSEPTEAIVEIRIPHTGLNRENVVSMQIDGVTEDSSKDESTETKLKVWKEREETESDTTNVSLNCRNNNSTEEPQDQVSGCTEHFTTYQSSHDTVNNNINDDVSPVEQRVNESLENNNSAPDTTEESSVSAPPNISIPKDSELSTDGEAISDFVTTDDDNLESDDSNLRNDEDASSNPKRLKRPRLLKLESRTSRDTLYPPSPKKEKDSSDSECEQADTLTRDTGINNKRKSATMPSIIRQDKPNRFTRQGSGTCNSFTTEDLDVFQTKKASGTTPNVSPSGTVDRGREVKRVKDGFLPRNQAIARRRSKSQGASDFRSAPLQLPPKPKLPVKPKPRLPRKPALPGNTSSGVDTDTTRTPDTSPDVQRKISAEKQRAAQIKEDTKASPKMSPELRRKFIEGEAAPARNLKLSPAAKPKIPHRPNKPAERREDEGKRSNPFGVKLKPISIVCAPPKSPAPTDPPVTFEKEVEKAQSKRTESSPPQSQLKPVRAAPARPPPPSVKSTPPKTTPQSPSPNSRPELPPPARPTRRVDSVIKQNSSDNPKSFLHSGGASKSIPSRDTDKQGASDSEGNESTKKEKEINNKVSDDLQKEDSKDATSESTNDGDSLVKGSEIETVHDEANLADEYTREEVYSEIPTDDIYAEVEIDAERQSISFSKSEDEPPAPPPLPPPNTRLSVTPAEPAADNPGTRDLPDTGLTPEQALQQRKVSRKHSRRVSRKRSRKQSMKKKRALDNDGIYSSIKDDIAEEDEGGEFEDFSGSDGSDTWSEESFTDESDLEYEEELKSQITNELRCQTSIYGLLPIRDSKEVVFEPIDQCHKIVHEILTTEKAYVSKLELIDQGFHFKVVMQNRTARMFPDEEVPKMFSNIKSIYQFHCNFLLPQLNTIFEKWEEEPRIGVVMRKFAPFLKIYSEYVKNYDCAIQTITHWCDKSPTFSTLVTDIQKKPECGSIRLVDHMLGPIQRIPRYEMLLKDYLKRLPQDSDDREDTQQALELVIKAASHSNEAMRKIDKFRKLLDISESLIGDIDLILPGRELIKEGKIIKISGRRGEHNERYIFLFNDMLLVCQSVSLVGLRHQYKIKSKMDIEGMKITESENLLIQDTFYVKSKQKSIELLASNSDEKIEWQTILWKTIKDYTKKQLTRFGNTETLDQFKDEELGTRAPTWIKDKDTSMCMQCSVTFSTFRRRHHCRACGIVVCAGCSTHKSKLQYDNNKENRVCDKCFLILEGKSGDLDMPSHMKDRRQVLQVKANDPAVVKGYLQMWNQDKKTWVRRWIAAHDDFVLYFFKAHQDVVAEVSLPLPGHDVKAAESGDKIDTKDKVFKLTTKSGQKFVHFFLADDRSHYQRWVDALEKLVKLELPANHIRKSSSANALAEETPPTLEESTAASEETKS